MDKYIKLDVIGQGCNGNSVILVKNLDDNKTYAMKRIFIDVNDEEQNKKNINEINIFKGLQHHHIVKYYESFIHKDKLCIIMEYADGGDLNKVIKKHIKEKKNIDENSIWNWFLQICLAINYIHSKKIIHRDIKSQNIFLNKKGEVKIGDFGISKVLENTMDYAKSSLGTPYFLSPEICAGEKYNLKTDIWMLGCVLYELSTLKKPFEGENFHILLKNILSKDILPIPKSYSDDLKEMIDMLLKKDANLRPTIIEIISYDHIVEKMKKFGFCESDISPVNKQEAEINFNTLNLQFDNLLATNEETYSNNFSKINSEKKSSKFNSNFFQDSEIPSPNIANSVRSNKIMNRQIFPFQNDYSLNYSECVDASSDINTLSKHQYSVPELHNKSLLSQDSIVNKNPIYDKIQKIRERNKSINYDHPNMIKYINYSAVETNTNEHSRNNKNNSTKIITTVNREYINNSCHSGKINKYYKEVKKGNSKAISINISSIQSPEIKAVYHIEGMDDNELNLNLYKIKGQTAVKKVKKFYDIIDILENNEETNLKIKFMKDKYKDKFDKLIDLLQNSENPSERVSDIKTIKNIVGDDYKIAQSFLKFIIAVSKSPNSK